MCPNAQAGLWVCPAATFAGVTSRDLASALRYAWRAHTIYDVHAPKAFSYLGEVVEDDRHFYWFDMIRQLRLRYAASAERIEVTDLGAGSQAHASRERRVRDIAASSATPPRFGEYLLKTADWCDARYMLELGTNLGIGTAYLAGALPADGRLISIDADAAVLAHARAALKPLPTRGEVRLVHGAFVDRLPEALASLPRVDLAFVDGHHDEEATKRYFAAIAQHTHAGSVVILDDVHWSAGMEAAWDWVKRQPGVSLSIDLYRWGVVFFDPAVRKPQHLDIVPWRWKPWHMGFFSSRAET